MIGKNIGGVNFGVMVAMLAMVIMPAAKVGAQARGDKPGNRANSVVIDLAKRDSKLREAVDGGLKPSVEQLKKHLADRVAAAKAAFEVAKRDNTDANVMSYNNAIAEAYRVAGEDLDAIRSQRGAISTATTDLTTAVGRVRKEFDGTVTALQDQLKRREAETQKRRADLEALAAKYAVKNDNGETLPIPADVDLAIRKLAVQYDLGEAQTAVLKEGRERLEQWRARLDQQGAALTRMQQEFDIVFTKADASIELLADVAVARRGEIQIGAVVGRVAKLTNDLVDAGGSIDEVLRSLNELHAQQPVIDPDSVTAPAATAKMVTSADILNRFLKTENVRASR